MKVFSGGVISNYDKLSDERLFELICGDDDRAFTCLYNRHAEHLYSVLIKYLKSEELVENALQDVFMKLWTERSRLSVPSNVKGYIYRAMRNCALNMVVRHQNGLKKAYQLAQSQETEYEMTQLEQGEAMESIQNEIAKLPKSMQNIISLKREGLTNQEISKKIDMPINTVAAYYSRSVKILREKLRGVYPILLLLIVYSIEESYFLSDVNLWLTIVNF